ncbi:hypothetical protein [Microbacterium sp. NIBRBAC000506063]|nr:hypothetical protein [Microbacterium sp. NIBRBAC000506063]
MGFGGALGLGLLLGGVNPKNLLLAASAGPRSDRASSTRELSR